MKKYKNFSETIFFVMSALFITAASNCYYVIYRYPNTIPVFVLIFIAGNLMPLYSGRKMPGCRYKICSHGNKCLKIFIISTIISVVYNFASAFILLPDRWTEWCIGAAITLLAENIIFWNGMLSVYCTSIQLGINIRVLGLVCGMIPVANLIMLGKIIRITGEEIDFEWRKSVADEERRNQQICAVKYPVLMVHGVFFRDSRYFNYWGRIPKELEYNGARIYYGEHQSASSIEDSGKELAARIKQIVTESGCSKLNIIAHSKGGLDCRYAIYKYGLESCVASLTTINTPHRGCRFSDYLMNKAPEAFKNKIADTYNRTLKKFGDSNPDFIAAVSDLSSDRCEEFNREIPAPIGVFCQSTGSRLNRATGG
ncbi:MAG: esterase/lipase family protein [Butyrivibrio sp.]